MNNPDLLIPVKAYFDNLMMPYYVSYGNHERTPSEQWQSVWGYKENHDFANGDFAFILAKTGTLTMLYECADHNWLNERLDHYANKKYIFIFMHITPKDWTTYAYDCPLVRQVIGAHNNVAVVYNGHDHDIDEVRFTDNTNYAFDGRFGGSWGIPYIGYRVTEIYQDGSIYTYQFDPATQTKINYNRLEFSKGYSQWTEIIDYSDAYAKNGAQSLKISGPDQAYGVYLKKPITEGKYVIESWVLNSGAGPVPVAGLGLVNTTAADPQAAAGNYFQSYLDLSNNKIYTDVTTDSVANISNYNFSLSSGTWYKVKTILDGNEISFYDPSGNILGSKTYNSSKLFPAYPEFRHQGAADAYYDLSIIRKYAQQEPVFVIGYEEVLITGLPESGYDDS